MNHLFLLLFGMVTFVAHAQVPPTNDVYDWSLVFDDDVFNVSFGENVHFLTTRTSVFKSEDTENWTECNWPLGIVRNGTSVAPGMNWNDERLIVGALDNGFFISTDSGESFSQTGPTGYGCQSVSILQLPNGEAIGMMGGYQRGLWKCGPMPETTWTNEYSVGADQWDIQYHDGDLFATSYAPNHPGGILKSADLGESWEIIYSTSYSANPLSYCILNDTLIYMNQQSETHHINMNNWSEIAMYEGTINEPYDLHFSAGHLFACNVEGIFISYDLGITWQAIGPNTSLFYHLVEHDGILWAAGETGLWSTQLAPVVPGCTDTTACNFDAEATSDDGSCIPSGCMEPLACNYNALAECDGEACDYTCCPGPGCCLEGTVWDAELGGCIPIEATCPEDLDFDGVVGVNDLMELLSAFGTDCPEPGESETAEWTCGDPVNYHGYDYATVQIGEQCWFAENLRAEHYANGDVIPGELSDSEWSNAYDTNLGAQAIYANDASNLADYGRLYNSYAVDDARGLCPSGWHVPTDEEFMTLEMELGMSESEVTGTGWRGTDQGAQMKTIYGWNEAGNGTNSSGFSCLPGGYRYINGEFSDEGIFGSFWSSSLGNSLAWTRDLNHGFSGIYRNENNLVYGFSVRCLKD